MNVKSILCGVLMAQSCLALVLENVGVPPVVVEGEEAVLSCDYNLKGQGLFSTKWYKNGFEFFRYMPHAKDPILTYPVPGVNVDVSRSDSFQVTLSPVTRETKGRYRCEVSSEAPYFVTLSNFGDLLVVVLPKSGPVITGGEERYDYGDEVDVNCTSGPSKPAVDLYWTVNDDRPEDSWLVQYPITNTTDGLYEATLGLRFNVTEKNKAHKGIRLKCTASIDMMMYSEATDIKDKPQKREALRGGLQEPMIFEFNGSPAAVSSVGTLIKVLSFILYR